MNFYLICDVASASVNFTPVRNEPAALRHAAFAVWIGFKNNVIIAGVYPYSAAIMIESQFSELSNSHSFKLLHVHTANCTLYTRVVIAKARDL